jgi:hypothetical protein
MAGLRTSSYLPSDILLRTKAAEGFLMATTLTTAMEKRVVFDFKISFLNGGSLKGEDFRLDIPGDEISDNELANYIIEDMRLLMVGETKIVNKKIIQEPHKRKSFK